jgi:hypothetical protein
VNQFSFEAPSLPLKVRQAASDFAPLAEIWLALYGLKK